MFISIYYRTSGHGQRTTCSLGWCGAWSGLPQRQQGPQQGLLGQGRALIAPSAKKGLLRAGTGLPGAGQGQGCQGRGRGRAATAWGRASGGCLPIVLLQQGADTGHRGGDAVLTAEQVHQRAGVRVRVGGIDLQQMGQPGGFGGRCPTCPT